ncbi:hypothetical protein JHD50_00905 [Sulfurimonas sp. MAG313]|nr:hypothetical protein [Sulfurimonas sp. MAG313]MDF1879870.1 hypothetical protein [Sulfurimonas sp. MAG313]
MNNTLYGRNDSQVQGIFCPNSFISILDEELLHKRQKLEKEVWNKPYTLIFEEIILFELANVFYEKKGDLLRAYTVSSLPLLTETDPLAVEWKGRDIEGKEIDFLLSLEKQQSEPEILAFP